MNQSEPNGEPEAIAEPEAITRDAATTWVTEPRTESAAEKNAEEEVHTARRRTNS